MDSVLPAFDPASPQAQATHDLFVQVLWLSAAIFAIVSGLILIAISRGRKRAKLPAQDFGNEKAEIAWMVGPIIIVLWLAAVSAKLVLTINAVPKADPKGTGETDIVVTGHQWWWQVNYAGSESVAANEIHIPVGKKLRVRLESADVIHCFWVPRLTRKMDLIPGRENYVWLEASEPGTYQGRCAEFCGAQHAWMEFQVFAHSEEDYARWQAGHDVIPPKPTNDDLVGQGHALFMKMTCRECHRIAGTEATAGIAPDLSHIASRKKIGGGVLENSPENLRRWLAAPNLIKPGCKMPNFKLNDQQLDQLVAYLETLK
ncbi:MAG: cytochrome c oxidase subunit II [Pirellulales bacterium]|nr:cytochrome c oxidase subunit II [Pirellulales bacterium]